jgi:hypothetical protein
MLTRLPVLAFVATMFIASGCGSSKNASSSTSARSTSTSASTGSATSDGSGPSLSTAQLVSKAEAICSRLNSELAGAKDVFSDLQGIARIAPRRAALEQAATTELSNLVPPASLTSDYQRLIVARRRFAEGLTKIGEAAAANNTQTTHAAFVSSTKAAAEITTVAERHGLKACAQVG